MADCLFAHSKIKLAVKVEPFEIFDALKNISNSKNSSFEIFEDPYIPNHEELTIWDTSAPLKTPQIFEIATLGYNLKQKCIPNLLIP